MLAIPFLCWYYLKFRLVKNSNENENCNENKKFTHSKTL